MTEEQFRRAHFLLNGCWPDVDVVWKHGDDYEDIDTYDPEEHARMFPILLAAVEDPEELHQFALNYNWDDGFEQLEQIIDSPLCDQGTALLLYWIGEPWYCLNHHQLHTPSPYDSDYYHFMNKLEMKYLSKGFQSRRIRIDPRNLFGDDYVEGEKHQPGFELIPEELKQASPGEPVEQINF